MAEIGTHAELMKARGLYFTLITAQMAEGEDEDEEESDGDEDEKSGEAKDQVDDLNNGEVLEGHVAYVLPTA